MTARSPWVNFVVDALVVTMCLEDAGVVDVGIAVSNGGRGVSESVTLQVILTGALERKSADAHAVIVKTGSGQTTTKAGELAEETGNVSCPQIAITSAACADFGHRPWGHRA